MVWVLKVNGKTRKQIAEAVQNLLDSSEVTLGNREIVLVALEYYQSGKADFGDYLIVAEGMHNGSHHVASFDKALCKEKRNCQHPSNFC